MNIRFGFLQFHGGVIGLVLFVPWLLSVLWLNCTDDGLEFQKKIGPTMAVIKGIQYLLFLLIGLWIATRGFTYNPLDQ